jgi:hypothetical protein
MGTPQAYGEFAEVLLAFFQAGDNFDFLTQNQLFRFPLTYTLLNGDDTWTFEELANYFGTGSFGSYSEATRAAIAEFAARIQAILGPADAGAPDA